MYRQLIFTALMIATLTTSTVAQVTIDDLIGDWEEVKVEGPFSGLDIKPPPRSGPPPEEPEPRDSVPGTILTIDEHWLYTFTEATFGSVEGYRLANDTIFSQEEMYWVKEVSRNELVLKSVPYSRGLTIPFSTTYTYRRVPNLGYDMSGLKTFVNQEKIGPYQLHGFYQIVIGVTNAPEEEQEEIGLNFRFYSDNVVIMGMTFSSPEASESPICTDCYRDISPYMMPPFKVPHPIQMGRDKNDYIEVEFGDDTTTIYFEFVGDDLIVILDGTKLKAEYIPYPLIVYGIEDLSDYQ